MAQRKLALLIGSGEFPGERELSDLRCPPRDVAGFAAVLEDPDRGGFAQVDRLVNRNRGDLEFRLNEVLLDAEPDDLVLVYYSGHGKLNRRGFLHLATPDTRVANLEATSLSASTLRGFLESTYAQRKVLILDCCFAGRVGDVFLRSSVSDTLQATFDRPGVGLYIISASTGIESAIEKEGDEYSVFTAQLIDAIASGRADVNRDGRIDMDELYRYVKSEVEKTASQTPMRWNLSGIGEISIAANPDVARAASRGARWQQLLELGREHALPNDVLIDALDFVEGRITPFDVDAAGQLVDQLVVGALGGEEFARRWRETREPPPSLPVGAPVRVLSIDGGGVRAIVPALVLAELEQRTGQPTCELFDLVAGSSFGALVALLLCAPRESGAPSRAADVAALLEERAPRLFTRALGHRVSSGGGLFGPRYPSAPLDALTAELFADIRLSGVRSEVFIAAYEIERQTPFYLRTRRARVDATYDFLLRDVARAAMALPSFFEPAVVEDVTATAKYALVDASAAVNNPAMAAYAEAMRMEATARDVVIVSLGTGTVSRPIRAEEARGWGAVGWVGPLLTAASQASSANVDYQLRQLVDPQRYLRLQPELLMANDAVDDTSPRNVSDLRQTAAVLISEFDREMDRMCHQLTAAAPVAVAEALRSSS